MTRFVRDACLVLVCLAVASGLTTDAQQPPGSMPCGMPCDLGAVTDKARVRVVVIGDFGYEGVTSGHTEVRQAIEQRHRLAPYDFGLTVGDNFYPSGVDTVAELERRWSEYDAIGLPFYATLGNHDYEGTEQVQVDFTSSSTTWRMPHRYYTFSAGPMRFFALDTDEGTRGFWGWLFRRPWSTTQRDWLAGQLAATTDHPWRIVYGHHPIRSNGHHGDEPRLTRGTPSLRSLLHEADAISVAGHDHDLQYLEADGRHFFVAGGGGKDVRPIERKGAAFSCGAHGFLELDATPDVLTFEFFGKDGSSLYRRVIRRTGAPEQPGDRSAAAPATCQ